jgi:hypothetical protein
MGSLWVRAIDAQSFSNCFEGVHGVVKKSGRGSSIFVFLCYNFSKSFEGVHEGPPPPLPSPLCVRLLLITLTDLK